MNSVESHPIDKISVYICAGLVSGAGALLLNVLPLLFGAFSESFGLSEIQLGNLALSMNLGFGLLGLASLLWVHRISWRVIASLSSLLVIAMILLMLGQPTYEKLLIVMAAAGAGTGALYALAMTIFGDSAQPEKAFGFKLGLESVPGALLLVLLPVAVVPLWGVDGMLLTIAVTMVVIGILPLPWVPKNSVRGAVPLAVSTSSAGAHRSIVWLSLLASLIFLTGVMSVWAFLELIGKKTGLSSDTIGTVLAIGFLINAVGGFIASALGLKAGRFYPMAVIIIVEVVGLVVLSRFDSLTTYVVGVFCFLISISFVLAYTFGIMAEFDQSGKIVALGALCLSIGAAFGPAIGGQLIENYGYLSTLLFSGGCSTAALGVYGVAVLRSRQVSRKMKGASTIAPVI
jgi:predicted MFS family arabinose efflux permease